MSIQDILPSLSLGLSIAALAVAVLTFYFVHIRRGDVVSTRPSSIFFGYDNNENGDRIVPKIVIFNTLLSTGQKSNIIESLYITVKNNERVVSFSFWGFAEQDKIKRGSGLFISQTGFSARHYFNPVDNENFYVFAEGQITIEMFVNIVGEQKMRSLFIEKIQIDNSEITKKLLFRSGGVIWNWHPEKRMYFSIPMHVYD